MKPDAGFFIHLGVSYDFSSRAGCIALWNRSIALRSWANHDFGSNGAQWEKEQRVTSELTKSNFERFACERYKEKRADEFWERFQRSNPNNGRKNHKKARFVKIKTKNLQSSAWLLSFLFRGGGGGYLVVRARIFRNRDLVYFKKFVQLFKNTSPNCKGEVCSLPASESEPLSFWERTTGLFESDWAMSEPENLQNER